jgi:hypothetical protein
MGTAAGMVYCRPLDSGEPFVTSPGIEPTDAFRDDGGIVELRRTGRRVVAGVAGLAVLLVVGATVAGVAIARSSAATPVATPVRITVAPSGSAAATPSSAPVTSSSAAAAALGTKVIPPAMSAEQLETTRAELTALAARLPADLLLTAPATWAQWAGQTPSYTDDVVSCPHIADGLAADLGERWTYSYGKLPVGPFGCYWTPVPWVPDVSRFFVSIGYQTGNVPDLLTGMDFCAGGVEAPRVEVPAVGSGAQLYGCDDANGRGYDLAVPDTGGDGVFFLHATGGVSDPPSEVADAMLAIIAGATRAYG